MNKKKNKKTPGQILREERERKYKPILKALKPLEKRFGKDVLRWALNRWNEAEREKSALLKEKKEVEQRLSEIKREL